MVEEAYDRPNALRTINSATFSFTRLLTPQTRLSAAYKDIMALLYKEKCRDFMNDTTINIVNSMLESPDIHHIFPELYCEKLHKLIAGALHGFAALLCSVITGWKNQR